MMMMMILRPSETRIDGGDDAPRERRIARAKEKRKREREERVSAVSFSLPISFAIVLVTVF